MLALIVFIFVITVFLGVILLTYVLQNKNPPKGLALIHGSLAATGLILLLLYSLTHQPSPWLSLLLFILVASGGALMIYRDITGKSIPKWLAVAHGGMALIAYVSLIVFSYPFI